MGATKTSLGYQHDDDITKTSVNYILQQKESIASELLPKTRRLDFGLTYQQKRVLSNSSSRVSRNSNVTNVPLHPPALSCK